MAVAHPDPTIRQWAMLTRLYVEALLNDPDLADQVWELWNAGVITDDLAARAWSILAVSNSDRGICGSFDDL